MPVITNPSMRVEEAAALLEDAAIALVRDAGHLARSSLADTPDGQEHDTFLYAWAARLAGSSGFLRQQKMARVLDDETLLRLVAFDIEVAQDRMTV